MALRGLLGLLCALTVLGVASAQIYTMNDGNYEQLTSSGGRWLLFFYTSGCPHCSRMKPIVVEASVRLHGLLRFAMIESNSKELLQRFSVDGYPSFRYCRASICDTFHAHTLQQFVDFGNHLRGNDVVSIHDADALRQHIRSNAHETRFVFVTNDRNKHRALQHAYSQAALITRHEAQFLSTYNPENLKLFSRPQSVPADWPLVVALRGHELSSQIAFAGSMLNEEFMQWVQENRYPFVGELDGNKWDWYLDNNTGLCAIACVDPALDYAHGFIEKLEGIVISRAWERFRFAWLNVTRYPEYVAGYGVEQHQLPTVLVMVVSNLTYYPAFDNLTDLDAQSLTRFLAQVDAGEMAGRSMIRGVWGHLRYAGYLLGRFVREHPIYAILAMLALAASLVLFAVVLDRRSGVNEFAAQRAISPAVASTAASAETLQDDARPLQQEGDGNPSLRRRAAAAGASSEKAPE